MIDTNRYPTRPSSSRATRHHLWITLLLGLSASASTAQAGLELSLRGQAGWLSVADPTGAEDEFVIERQGGGLSLGVGYAFTPRFAAMLRVGGNGHATNYDRDAVYGTVLLEGQWRPLPEASVQPYLLIGLGGATVEIRGDVLDTSISGAVASLGAGLLLPLTDHFRVESDLRFDGINWNRVRVTLPLDSGSNLGIDAPLDDSGAAANIGLGVGWSF